MISFRHLERSVSLTEGQIWQAPPAAQLYQDTESTRVRALIDRIAEGADWRQAVNDAFAKENPWLNRIITDPSRDLYFHEHSPPANFRILDIGAGWGQICLPFARREDLTITAVEPTPERLEFIQAAARQEGTLERLHLVGANFLELSWDSRFDLACCIGVLEWVPRFTPGDPRAAQVEFLRRIRESLAPGGQLVLAIENRFGLKYLLGARDDHTAGVQVSVFDAALARRKWQASTGEELRTFTYTRAELEGLLRDAGFSDMTFHGAFPDYKIPQLILELGSTLERHLRDQAIPPEHDGCDGSPLPFQEELVSHYRSLAGLGIASDFAPSFIVSAA